MTERFKVCKSEETNNFNYGPSTGNDAATEKLLSDSHNICSKSHNVTGL